MIQELEDEERELLSGSVRAEAVKDNFQFALRRGRRRARELRQPLCRDLAASPFPKCPRCRACPKRKVFAQLVGAAAFAVYFISDDGSELIAIASEGVNAAAVARVSPEVGPIGRVFSSGTPSYDVGRDVTKGSVDDPVAVIPPFMIEGRAHGAIAILGDFPQKTEFVQVDRELFKLLGAQAAPALVNARLFMEASREGSWHSGLRR